MANSENLNDTYDYITRPFKYMLKTNHPDITNAFFNGDYSGGITLEALQKAQHAKFELIKKWLRLEKGHSVLEVGSGWGNWANYAKSQSIYNTGVTPVVEQWKVCQEAGFDVTCAMYQDYKPKKLFDGFVCIGAWEHFATEDDGDKGTVVDRHREAFQYAHKHTKQGTRLYLQAMLFVQGKILTRKQIDEGKNAPKGSLARDLFNMRTFYPGSYLPTIEQLEEAAKGYYRLEEYIEGREDYVQTMKCWGKRFWHFDPFEGASWRKLWEIGKLIPPLVKSTLVKGPFFYQIRAFFERSNQRLFERGDWNHARSVWVRIDRPEDEERI